MWKFCNSEKITDRRFEIKDQVKKQLDKIAKREIWCVDYICLQSFPTIKLFFVTARENIGSGKPTTLPMFSLAFVKYKMIFYSSIVQHICFCFDLRIFNLCWNLWRIVGCLGKRQFKKINLFIFINLITNYYFVRHIL